MPRYVIHIGPHKTATTYLQAAFEALRPELAARGIHYSDSWLANGTLGHAALPARLATLSDAALEAEFAALNAAAWGTVLISSEGLVRLSRQAAGYLRRLVGDNPAEIVYYVRPWTEVVVSGWRGEIKRGGTPGFLQRLNAHLSDPARSHLINIERTLEPFAAAFGDASLRIASFGAVMAEKIDILDHFGRSFLGIDEMPAVNRERKNVSFGTVDSEILRALNVIRQLRGGGAPIRAGHFVQLKEEVGFPLARAALGRDLAPLRLRVDGQEMSRFHAAIVTRFKAGLVAPLLPRGRLIPAKPTLPDHVVGDYAYAEGVMQELQEASTRAGEIVDSGAVRGPRDREAA